MIQNTIVSSAHKFSLESTAKEQIDGMQLRSVSRTQWLW